MTLRLTLCLGVALALGACDMPAPAEPEPMPPPQLEEWQGPRTMSFVRVPDLDNGTVHDLDLDVGGMSVAVTQSSATVRKVWVDRGAGWSLFTEPTLAASCACIEPNGDHVFVGLQGAQYAIFRRDGSLVQSPTSYVGLGDGDGQGPWTTRQCAWVPERGGRVFVTLSSDNRLRGALLSLDVGRSTGGASWTRFTPPIQHPTGAPHRVDLSYDGLSVSLQSGVGVGVTAGVAYGFSAHALTQHTISGLPLVDPDASWTILDPFPETAQYGGVRDFGSHPPRGSAFLYRDVPGGSWRIMVDPPPGYRGIATLDAPELRGTALAVDVDAQGLLWVGGDGGLGLHRSTEPLRVP